LWSVSTHSVTHFTNGHVTTLGTVSFAAAGMMSVHSYFSLVDQSVNSDFPCANGAHPASAADTGHSSPVRATIRNFDMDTVVLSSIKVLQCATLNQEEQVLMHGQTQEFV